MKASPFYSSAGLRQRGTPPVLVAALPESILWKWEVSFFLLNPNYLFVLAAQARRRVHRLDSNPRGRASSSFVQREKPLAKWRLGILSSIRVTGIHWE